MKVKPVSISIAYDGGFRSGQHLQHTVMVDSDGNVHERFSDMPAGAWTTWTPDLLPNRPRRPRRK